MTGRRHAGDGPLFFIYGDEFKTITEDELKC